MTRSKGVRAVDNPTTCSAANRSGEVHLSRTLLTRRSSVIQPAEGAAGISGALRTAETVRKRKQTPELPYAAHFSDGA